MIIINKRGAGPGWQREGNEYRRGDAERGATQSQLWWGFRFGCMGEGGHPEFQGGAKNFKGVPNLVN